MELLTNLKEENLYQVCCMKFEYCCLSNTKWLINIIDVGLFQLMEKDIFHAVIEYGPTNFASVLFQYNIISSFHLNITGLLGQYLPPNNVSVILVEILANNVKHTATFKDFINFLANVSSLHYLYKTMNRILG